MSTTSQEGAGFADRVLTLALGRGFSAPRPEQALALLRAHDGPLPPALRLIQGEWQGLPAGEPLPRWGAPPLALVAFSSLARVGCEPALLQALDRLLAAGADPNAGLPDPEAGDRALPPLYGAVARAQSQAMVQRLLAAGADPNDGESLYHAVEQPQRGMVQALVAAGARWSGTNALFRQLDFDAPAHLAQVLALGADADERSAGTGTRPLQHAVDRGRSLDDLRQLVAHGADIAGLDAHGRSLAWHAARAGRRDVLQWLAQHGLAPPDDPVERFLAACAAADAPAARDALAAHPGLIGTLPPADLALLPEQAQRGALSAVALMLELGWPVQARGPWGASALNQAAFRGDAAMVALLLRHGARWNETNGYGGTALGSCLHAGCNEPVAGGDYAEVLRLLLADGAPPPLPDDPDLPDALRAVVLEAIRPSTPPSRSAP
jgi:ankyrin repeat protein